MYDGPLAEPVIYTILFKYSRSCAILSVAKRFVTIFYFFTQFWIVGNKYFKNTYTRCVFGSDRSPRSQDVVCPCVRPCVRDIMLKRALEES